MIPICIIVNHIILAVKHWPTLLNLIVVFRARLTDEDINKIKRGSLIFVKKDNSNFTESYYMYPNGVKHGLSIETSIDSGVVCQRKYVNGLIVGDEIYKQGDEIIGRVTYFRGEPHLDISYKNGRVIETGIIDNDLDITYHISYYECGSVCEVFSSHAGITSGEYYMYYPSGKIRERGFRLRGRYITSFWKYNENGSLVDTGYINRH